MEAMEVVTINVYSENITNGQVFCWECYYSHWQYEWYEKLLMYVPPILILLGTVGNILNLIVLQSRIYKKSPCCVALSALALADMSVLNIGLLRLWILVSKVCLYYCKLSRCISGYTSSIYTYYDI